MAETDAPKENYGPQLMGVNIGFLAAALIANALRCFVRIKMVKGFGVDDWLMAFATASFACYCSFSISGVVYGTGRHHADLDLPDIKRAIKYWWFCFLFYALTMITSKLSVGVFLLRITVKKVHIWIIYFAMFASLLAGVLFFFVSLFQCWPISHFWEQWDPSAEGKCMKVDVIVALSYLYTVFSIASDFTFAILPAFLVWGLQLGKRTKMALIPLLAMGCIASSAVAARAPYLSAFHSKDFLFDTVYIAVWSTVEQGLAITAGSLATLRPMFAKLKKRLGLSTSGRGSLGPSKGYGPPSPGASRALGGASAGGRRKGSVQGLNTFGMASLTETTCKGAQAQATERDVEKGADGEKGKRRRSFVWRMKSTSRSGGVGVGGSRTGGIKEDSESQKSLKRAGSDETIDVVIPGSRAGPPRGRGGSGGGGAGDGLAIMVERSFDVIEPQR